jgi:hypothetical protein
MNVNGDNEQGVILFCMIPSRLNWRSVKAAIIKADLGWIERVDVSPSSSNFKKCFIYFEPNSWNKEKESELEHLKNGNALKLFYAGEKYLHVKLSTAKRISREEAISQRQRLASVRVEMD